MRRHPLRFIHPVILQLIAGNSRRSVPTDYVRMLRVRIAIGINSQSDIQHSTRWTNSSPNSLPFWWRIEVCATDPPELFFAQ